MRTTFILFLCVSASLRAPSPAATPPNIVIILADDLGYADTGFNGSETAKTPHLDRFAKSGVVLADFRACPMCSPTRAGLLTGRWPIRFGMMRAVIPPWSKYGLPAKENTLPELLADAGYERRGIFGKWHLGHTTIAHLPPQNGFTHFIGHYNGAIDYFTHEREDELDWHQDNATLREDGYATDLIGQHAAAFIRDSPTDKAYFAYVPFNAPHFPLQATQTDLATHAGIRDKPRRTYAAMVTAMDRGIGKILTEIESRPDADNTLVIFFSDNGGILRVGSNAPYRGAKLNVYEGGTRVAAALRWPARKLSGGKRFDGRIGYIDILPTVLSAAGLRSPANLDGINFLPTLSGRTQLPDRPWFSYLHQSKSASSSVHQGAWKLIAKGDAFSSKRADLKLELYNLTTDPSETSNVAKQHPDRVTAMLKQLKDFGTLQKPGAGLYSEGRKNFTAPKDWLIEP
ncbi:MAG: arylsulfatase B [Verrucomicrobiales bacterium]|jgi:arylsulfatase B